MKLNCPCCGTKSSFTYTNSVIQICSFEKKFDNFPLKRENLILEIEDTLESRSFPEPFQCDHCNANYSFEEVNAIIELSKTK